MTILRPVQLALLPARQLPCQTSACATLLANGATIVSKGRLEQMHSWERARCSAFPAASARLDAYRVKRDPNLGPLCCVLALLPTGCDRLGLQPQRWLGVHPCLVGLSRQALSVEQTMDGQRRSAASSFRAKKML
jgi:hypothetical protein